MVCFGIHVGSTNMCLALFKDGNTCVVANDSGDRVTPACVAFTDKENFVGITAKHQLLRNPRCVVTNILLAIETCTNGHKHQCNDHYAKIVKDGDDIKYEINCDNKTKQIHINEIMNLLFKKILDIALNQLDADSSRNAAISVPYHFTDKQRELIKNAAVLAGFNVQGLISRPASCALAYGLGQTMPSQTFNVLVFRVGGVSTDVSIVEVNSGMYFVKANLHKQSLGGELFTQLLLEHLLKEFQRMNRHDASQNKRSIAKLRNAAENAKHVLSTISTAHCFVESLYEGTDFSSNITRARYDSLISGCISSYLNPIDDVLNQLNIKDRNLISKVILCGGAIKTPKLQSAVSNMFPNSEILTSISADEVFAHGAANQAALMNESNRSLLLLQEVNEIPVMDSCLYIKTSDDDGYVCVIESGTPVPVRRQHQFSSSDENAKVELYAKSEDDDDHKLLAKVVLTNVPVEAQISVTVHVKSDGGLHLCASESTTNQCESVNVANES